MNSPRAQDRKSALPRKILVALTGVEKYPQLDRATGLWLGEAVHFVAQVEAAGYAVDFVSPRGGNTPIDPHSLALAEPIDWAWYANKAFMNRLGNTLSPQQVDARDYAAIYFAGGHGVMWDFPEDAGLQALSRAIYEAGGVVSAVCHGVVALLNLRLSDGRLLIEGKRVTGFSNEEETLAGLDPHVPFLTETALKQVGAVYEHASAPWLPFAVSDARVVTGQNPASGGEVARQVLATLVQG